MMLHFCQDAQIWIMAHAGQAKGMPAWQSAFLSFTVTVGQVK